MYVQHNEYTNFIYNNILNIRKGFKNEKVKKGLDDTFLNLELSLTMSRSQNKVALFNNNRQTEKQLLKIVQCF